MSGRDSGSASSSASGSDSDRASGSDNGQRGRVDRNGDPLPFFEFPTHPFFDLTYPKEERDYRFSFNYDEEAQARLDAINIFGEFELGFPTSANGWLLACWAFGVVFALMGAASQRLYAVGARALDTGLNAGQVATLVASSVLLLYVGAYRCVHLSWAPVTARRCLIMPSGLGCKHFFHSALMVIIAPLFACGFVYAPPRRLLIANGLAIIAALGSVGLRHVPSPWNEVVHAALALVLAASCVSFAFVFGRACHSGLLPLDVDALAAGKQEKDARQVCTFGCFVVAYFGLPFLMTGSTTPTCTHPSGAV